MHTVEAKVSWGFLLLGLKTLSLIQRRKSDLKQGAPPWPAAILKRRLESH